MSGPGAEAVAGEHGRYEVRDLESEAAMAVGAASTATSSIVPGSTVSADIDADVNQTRKSSTINENLVGDDVEIASEKHVKCSTSVAVTDEKKQLQEEEDEEWDADPANARNWPAHRKWISMAVVRRFLTSLISWF